MKLITLIEGLYSTLAVTGAVLTTIMPDAVISTSGWLAPTFGPEIIERDRHRSEPERQ